MGARVGWRVPYDRDSEGTEGAGSAAVGGIGIKTAALIFAASHSNATVSPQSAAPWYACASDSRKDVFAMESTSRVVPVWLGGLVVGGAIILIPVSEGIRDTHDICGVGVTSPVTVCQPAILPSPDLPHGDHVPAATRNIPVAAASTTSTMATSTIAVAPSK